MYPLYFGFGSRPALGKAASIIGRQMDALGEKSRSYDYNTFQFQRQLEPLLKTDPQNPALKAKKEEVLTYALNHQKKRDWILLELLNHAGAQKGTQAASAWVEELEVALAKVIKETKNLDVLDVILGLISPDYCPTYALTEDPNNPLAKAVFDKLTNIRNEVIEGEPVEIHKNLQDQATAKLKLLREKMFRLMAFLKTTQGNEPRSERR